MNLRFKTTIVVILFIFMFPQKVNANQIGKLYYFSYDDKNTNENLVYKEFEFCGNFTREEIAFVIFSNLFDDSNEYYFTPQNVKILNIYSQDDCLYLNLSKEIKGYGGGSSYELRLKTLIIQNSINIPTINRVTLLIDGVVDYLPESSVIFNAEELPQL